MVISVRDHQPRRVVVTGIGVVAANGSTKERFWASIRDGVSAAAPMTRFELRNDPTTIACQVNDFDPSAFVDAKEAKRMDRSALYGVAAAKTAVSDAGIDFTAIDADRTGLVEGTSVSNNAAVAREELAYAAKGYRGVSLSALVNGYCGAGSGEISMHTGVRGHAITMSTGSSSGNDVMGYALRCIQSGEVDIMLTGAAEAPILPSLWGTFCKGRVMTRRNDNPKTAMSPFDADRDGFVLGEGAAFMVFEELNHALARGAQIYAEVLAHGRACESYDAVAPHPDGVGVIRGMEKALRGASLDLTEIDYINAHGTATEANDLVESKAIRKFFGSHADRLAVSSTKPITGHTMAAAGALESVVCALAIHHQVLPPTINLRNPAQGCDLDYVRAKARPYPIRAAMNLSTGFGGKNACLLMSRYSGI